MKGDPDAEPELRMLIQYCAREYPAARTVDIKDPSDTVAQGHRIGAYSDLHILRGLALALDESVSNINDLTESDLESIVERFYAKNSGESTCPHLINHPDDSGYYVPFVVPAPMVIEGVPRGYADKISIAFGSSVALLNELDRINTALNLPGDLGQIGEQPFILLAGKHRWPTAAYVWGVLRLYARESLERPGFVQFC
jgi:hypothetical protein